MGLKLNDDFLSLRKGKYLGSVFGFLTVTDMFIDNNRLMCKSVCKCGNEKICAFTYLKIGDTDTCGRCRVKKDIKHIAINTKKYVGVKFNKLTIIEILPKERNVQGVRCKASCECGVVKEYRVSQLEHGG